MRVLFMATVNVFLFVIVSKGQGCNDGSPALTMSYDTLFMGGGNASYNFGFPQFDTSYIFHFPAFDPSKGTLLKVDMQTMISVRYSYDLENDAHVQSISKVIMNRADEFTCSALSAPIQNNMYNNILSSYKLSASDGVTGSGPDYVEAGPLYKYRNYPINNSFTNNVAGFLGNGIVDFHYETTTDVYPTGTTSSFHSKTYDSVYFKMIYYYCLTAALPATITYFTASRLSSGNIQLNWLTPDDYFGKSYVIEKSTNGNKYAPVLSVSSKSNTGSSYSAQYTPAHEDKNKLFFRIKVAEKNGQVTYSAVRDVNLPGNNEGVMKVYPTITTDAFNIYFPVATKGDYLVNIRSVSGQMVQQSSFTNTSNLKVIFNTKMQAGLYLVEAINKKTQESRQSKIIVQ